MKRIKLKSSDTRRVRLAPSRSRSVDQELVRERLGAESVGQVSLDGSPLSLGALRSELVRSLRSTGGRPALEGTERRQKIPMSELSWRSLQDLAEKLSTADTAVTPGQVASRLLSSAIEALKSEYAHQNALAQDRLRVSEPVRPIAYAHRRDAVDGRDEQREFHVRSLACVERRRVA